MERTESLTASLNSRSQFEREKEKIIVEINQSLEIVNRNLAQLNQNLESAISLGANFGRVSSLWSEFGAIINPPIEDDDGADVGCQNGDVSDEYMDEEASDSYTDNDGVDAQMDTDM